MKALCIMMLCGALVACVGDFGLEDELFPCRAPEDCVEGFECHPQRYVCVEVGSSTTATQSASLSASSACRP